MRVSILIIFTALSLPALSGCHLFSSGAIDCTSDDPGCLIDTGDSDTDTGGQDSETDTGGETGDTDTAVDTDTGGDTDTGEDTAVSPDTSLGIVLSLTVGGDWQAVAWNPSNWLVDAPDVYRGGTGAGLGGPATFDADSDTIYVAAAGGKLYGLRNSSQTGATASWAVPGEVHDLAVLDGVVYMSIDTELYRLDPAGSAGVEHVVLGSGSSTTTGLSSIDAVFAGEGGIYLIGTETDGARSLGFYDPATDHGAVIYSAFDPDGSYAGGDGFMGPSDKAYACSSDGAVYLIINLSRGDTTPYAQAAGLSEGDVLACGWDDTLDMFLIFSASTGILGIDTSGNQEVLLAPEGDFEIYGGNVF